MTLRDLREQNGKSRAEVAAALGVADRLREMWEEHDNVMARLLDIKSDIERSGEFGLPEKNKLLDLKIECEELAYEFGKILGGVA